MFLSAAPNVARRALASLFGTSALLASSLALADRVTVLPLSGAGVTKQELDDVRARTREGAADKRHALSNDAEQGAAERAVKDGVADTRDEYTAAGKASNAEWAIGGRVESRGHYYRVEIEACQVSTGRVESLARNVERAEERRKVGEMLGLLLRPEGITNANIPWLNEAPPAAPVAKEEPPPPKPTPPVEPPKPVVPREPEPPPRPYAENKPFAVGVGAGVLSAVGRPANASGAATTVDLLGSFGYALEAVPGLELRGELGGGIVAPRSVFFAAGARYMWTIRRVVLGPELEVGAFFPVGGDKEARFLVRGSPVVGIALADTFAIEAFGDAMLAPGGTGMLVLVGGGARGVVRF